MNRPFGLNVGLLNKQYLHRLSRSAAVRLSCTNLASRSTRRLYTQQKAVFFKKKFGLYKPTLFLNKKLKQKLMWSLKHIKNPLSPSYGTRPGFKTQPKILFYKKYHKLYFRGGRRVLHSYLNIKKYMIQKILTKKINSSLKKNFIRLAGQNDIGAALVQCGLFFTFVDAVAFINRFGILLNNRLRYGHLDKLLMHDKFAVITSSEIIFFFKKRKQHLIKLLKKIKIYKYRVKKYSTKKSYNWVPMMV